MAARDENGQPMSDVELHNELMLRLYPVAMLTFPRVVNEPLGLLGHSLSPGLTL